MQNIRHTLFKKYKIVGKNNCIIIKDGKKDRGLDIITVSGNLVDIFKDVVEVGSDAEVSPSGVSAPSVMIKKIVVSGK